MNITYLEGKILWKDLQIFIRFNQSCDLKIDAYKIDLGRLSFSSFTFKFLSV